ncbi:MAG: SusC/RagA family TonB-linked outer membrane protein [Bacteroidales bacterium]
MCALLCSPLVFESQNSLFASVKEAYQSTKGQTIKGVIVDQDNEPVIGASVFVEGTSKGVTTDLDGNYQISGIEKGETLTISYIGYKPQKIVFKGNNLQAFRVITMYEDSEALDEVQIVAFSTQKKESVVSSISTVKPAELKVPSSNLTTGLGGRIAGLISYQTTGEPGRDNAQFFVRGVTSFGYAKSPLILIDGLELTTDDLARLNTDDIESFSILKDATSSALYGSRGANGVILVTTKQGTEGKAKLNIRFENSISEPVSKIKLADPITYMRLHNEAVTTRDPLAISPYSQEKIDNTIRGLNPNVYPQVDWYDMLLKDQTSNQRVNMNLSGGGRITKYYIAANYTHDTGLLKVDKRNNFNQNIDINRVNVRSNVNVNVTNTTEVILRMNGSFDDYSGPLKNGDEIYGMVTRANPVAFPAYYEPDERNLFTKHILFGNVKTGDALNPYAEVVRGYKNSSRTFLSMQAEIKQDLGMITKGLTARLNVNTDRTSYFESKRFYNPYYYIVGKYDKQNDIYQLTNLNPEGGTEFLNYEKGSEWTEAAVYMEGAVNYARTFAEKHDVGGLLVFTMRNKSISSAADLQSSLAQRNLGLAGRLTYGYDSRYFIEGNFGYNGSERFSKKHRFGFFPSVGLGWLISNEKFFKANVNENILSQLKLKATYGLVGNDRIGSINDRFFYLSNVNLNGGAAPGFGTDMNKPNHRPTVVINRYANDEITWEISKKLDIGLEMSVLKDFKIIADYFREDRSNILMDRASVTPEAGFEAAIRSNVGEAYSQGFDGSLDYNKAFANGLWVQGRANFTYAVGKYKVFEEPLYEDAPWLSRVNKAIGQQFGYIAESLFTDQAEVDASPQQFGKYGPGDIKYRDINNDGVINFKDQVPLGNPTTPQITYGFGFSAGYKGFDLSAFFQGNAKSSFWIDQNATAPFVNKNGNNTNGLLQVYADNHWSESNQNPYALWPRLSAYTIENNNQLSTWFMRDNSFLRLKSLEVGYTVPDKYLRKIFINSVRVYATGTNLLTFSKFKLWDPEMGGNGLGYPIQRVFNFGFQLGI